MTKTQKAITIALIIIEVVIFIFKMCGVISLGWWFIFIGFVFTLSVWIYFKIKKDFKVFSNIEFYEINNY